MQLGEQLHWLVKETTVRVAMGKRCVAAGCSSTHKNGCVPL